MNNNKENSQTKKIFNINTVSWILGPVFFFSSLEYLLSLEIINFSLIFMIAIMAFPPSFKLFKKKFYKISNIKLGNFHRLFLIITLFLIFNLLNSSKLEIQKIPKDKLINQNKPEENTTFNYQVDRVIDGDTIKVLIGGKSETIRLIGIDTPEIVHPTKPVQCFGVEASSKLKELLEGKKVYLKKDNTQDNQDKYSRFLRYVYRDDDLFINKWMIENGYAYEFTYKIPYLYQNEFKVAQKNAQKNKLGLWKEGVCDNFKTSPIQENKKNCLIKGNISYTSKEKIFHSPGCDDYTKTVINESKGEKWFCSEEEASLAGWKKAKNCP